MTSASAACGSSIWLASETAFRYSGMNNFQIQFARNQHALPMTRNYMITEEDRLREIDSKTPRFRSISAE